MLFLLIAGHALADYPLQNEAMATCKNRNAHLPLQKEVPWYYWLTAHALIHGMVAATIVICWTNDRTLGIAIGLLEASVHWVIDELKNEGITNIHIDQALHVLCKVVWWALITYGALSF